MAKKQVHSVENTDKEEAKPAPTCLTCEQPAHARGLCSTCRSAAWRAVGQGLVTEEELVKGGLLLPRAKAGRPATNGFSKRLAQLRTPRSKAKEAVQ